MMTQFLKQLILQAGNVSFNNDLLTVNPVNDFSELNSYYIHVDFGAITDQTINTNPYAGISDKTTWNFTTGDFTDPVVVFDPADGSTDIDANVSVTLTFSEAIRKIDDSELTNSDITDFILFKETDKNGSDVVFTGTIDASKQVVNLSPVSTLKSNQIYYVKLLSGLEDNGNNIVASDSITFATADTEPPVTSFDPVDGSVNVDVNKNIVITISEAVRLADNSELTDLNVGNYLTLKETDVNGTDVSFSATINPEKTIITIDPSADLKSKQFYYVSINSGLEDNADNNLSPANITFETRDIDAPVMSFNIADNAVNVNIGTNIVVTFSEAVRALDNSELLDTDLSDYIILKETDVNGADVSYSATINPGKTIITIDPSANLKSKQLYVAGIMNGLEDYSDNILANDTVSFTTQDTEMPSISFDPVNGSTDIDVNTNITITFSEAVRKADDSELTDSDLEAYIVLSEKSSGRIISGSLSINPEKTIITIDPDIELRSNTEFEIGVKSGLEDSSDNAVAGEVSGFTTTTSGLPSVVFTPANDSTGIDLDANVILTFSEPVIKVTGGEITSDNLPEFVKLFEKNLNTSQLEYSATINSTEFILDPDNDFKRATDYYAVLLDSLSDLPGNPLKGDTIKFTTKFIDNPPLIDTVATININETDTALFKANAVDADGDTVYYALGSGAIEEIDP